MIAIEINRAQLQRLTDAVNASGKKLSKEIAGAINQVSRKTKLEMGREIRKQVAIPKDEVEKPLKIKTQATGESLSAIVSLKETPRLGLRHFGAKQDKRGVSYKISKTGGRGRIDGAFMGPKPGVIRINWRGNVFVRVGPARKMTKGRYQGKMRQPIQQRFGVSAYGTYKKNDMAGPQLKAIEDELSKQLDRRINLNVLRASGLVTT
jgi:hypothetical protein